MRKPAIILLLLVLTACGLFGSREDNHPDIPGKIVFSAEDSNGNSQIYTINADGSEVRQLTNEEFSSTDPAWSPDGERIAYSRSDGSTGGEALWVMDADGSNEQPPRLEPRREKSGI